MKHLLPVIITLFVIAALLRIDFYFNILYLLLAVYLLSKAWMQHAMQRMHARRRFVNRAFTGEEIPVTLELRNTSWLPVPWVEIHDSLPVGLASPPFYRQVISLGGRQTARFEYTLHSYRRGYYAIGPLHLHTGDLLGLMPQASSRQEREYVIIYPRVVPLNKLGLPTHSPLAVLPAPAPLFEDPTRVMGTRAYQVGDSPRRIHWSASASAGHLLVKRYQPAIARETLVCLDMTRENYDPKRIYDASELAVTVAASLANHIILRERLAVGLATQALDPLDEAVSRFKLPTRRERAHLMSVLEVLARVQLTEAPPLPFADFLRRESLALPWGATLVVITGRESDALFAALLNLRQRGFAVALILVMAEAADTSAHSAESLGFPVYRVQRERDVEVI